MTAHRLANGGGTGEWSAAYSARPTSEETSARERTRGTRLHLRLGFGTVEPQTGSACTAGDASQAHPNIGRVDNPTSWQGSGWLAWPYVVRRGRSLRRRASLALASGTGAGATRDIKTSLSFSAGRFRLVGLSWRYCLIALAVILGRR